MIGFTCREHIATVIATREPILCRRWIPSFARTCTDCGALRDRWPSALRLLAALVSGSGERGGDIAKTVRRMSEASAGFRARKARERVTS
jgi:hypothetical protein